MLSETMCCELHAELAWLYPICLRAAVSPSTASGSGCNPAASLPTACSQTCHTELFVNTKPANITTASVRMWRALGSRERQPVPCVSSKRQKKEAPPKPLFISSAQWSNAALGKFKLVLKASVLCCFFTQGMAFVLNCNTYDISDMAYFARSREWWISQYLEVSSKWNTHGNECRYRSLASNPALSGLGAICFSRAYSNWKAIRISIVFSNSINHPVDTYMSPCGRSCNYTFTVQPL